MAYQMRNLYDQVVANANSQAFVSLYARPTLAWKLQCDQNQQTQRANVASLVSMSDIETPSRLTVAFVFIWIALGIECVFFCCSFCARSPSDTADYVPIKGVSMCLTGCIVVNLIWMLQTGANLLHQNLETVQGLDVLN